MKPVALTRVLILLMVALTISSSARIVAQDESSTFQGPSSTFRVFPLENAFPDGVLPVVQTLYGKKGVRVASDRRTNVIVVQGPTSLVDQIGQLIERLDIPASEDVSDTTIIKPENRSVEEFYDLVKMHVSPAGRYVFDESRNVIVVRDAASSVSRLKVAIERLDTKAADAATISLEFLILQPGGESLSSRQSSIQEELARLGLKDYGVHRQVVIKVREGNRFSVTKDGAQQKLLISGTVRLNRESRAAGIDLKVDISGAASNVSFSTSLQAPLGDQVLVGLAPSTDEPLRHLVLAVRATY